MRIIGNDWDNYLSEEFEKDYYKQLRQFLNNEYENHLIYPPAKHIFNALRLCNYEDTKVVILGQDPYHEKGQAMGLAFSVPDSCPLPPSLQNIFKEIEKEYGYLNTNGDLIPWAKQGVLLLNTSLTVREGSANSHSGHGWEILTDKIIEVLANKKEALVFLLWGNNAREKKKFIHNENHLLLESVHPSPLSAYNGFFGNGHFIQCNQFLKNHQLKEIDWHT